MLNKDMVKIGRHMRLFNQIAANGGGFYVRDCQPWQIKAGCDRFDCPMRSLALPPEARPEDVLIECNPVGDLADLLIKLQRTNTIEVRL